MNSECEFSWVPGSLQPVAEANAAAEPESDGKIGRRGDRSPVGPRSGGEL